MATNAAAKTAAKVRYIGRRTRHFGRPLWEILLNLRDFGIGRLIIRSCFERYPESTYYRILSCEPHVIEYPNSKDSMKGIVIAEPTFRGRVLSPIDIGGTAHLDDYRLLHKHEEEEYKNKGPKYLEPTKILPRDAILPPVWLELFEREKGRKLTEDERRMKVVYKCGETALYRIAEEGEKPSFEIVPGHSPGHMSLYEGVVWKRQLKDQEPSK